MARRRLRLRSATERAAALVAAVVVAGVLLGVGLSQGWWLGQSAPPAGPLAIPASRDVAVDDAAIDAGVRAALDRAATVVKVATSSRLMRERGQVYQWTARTVDIKARSRVTDLSRQIGQQVAPAGGQILEQTPTFIRIGVRRAGLDLVTHDIQLIPFVPAARVAILFDDAGGSLEQLEPILALGRSVTVTVLPGLRYSREVAARAQEGGLEVLLHLPMEPEERGLALGPGGITTGMSDVQIAQVVATDLSQVPGAIGLNNHMGSKATADERVMRAVLQEVKSHGLIFVDSVTAPQSVGMRLAMEMQIRTASRSVFLDNQNKADAIRAQIQRLIILALERKDVVAIGHATRLTPRVLKEMLVEFDRHDIELVPVSALVK